MDELNFQAAKRFPYHRCAGLGCSHMTWCSGVEALGIRDSRHRLLTKSDTVAAVSDVREPSPLCMFVVDDNEDAAVMLSELLRTFGHRVHTFFDGPSALEVAGKLRSAAAVLDIGMPGMHGYELAERMRQISPNTCLIACTGWGAAHDRARAKSSGFHHHLVKPVGMNELQTALSGIERAHQGCC